LLEVELLEHWIQLLLLETIILLDFYMPLLLEAAALAETDKQGVASHVQVAAAAVLVQ
jgi:hypothetical protein